MKLHNRAITSAEAMEYIAMKDAVAYLPGMALSFATGVADKTGATVAPNYISNSQATGTTGGFLQAFRVLKDMTFECLITASGASLNIGDKVTIDTNGVDVTATTTSGVAEIVDFPDGTKTSGSRVLVKF